jgi:hypothetical protein
VSAMKILVLGLSCSVWTCCCSETTANQCFRMLDECVRSRVASSSHVRMNQYVDSSRSCEDYLGVIGL